MTHVVAGYPSREGCIELLLGMQQAGVDKIEVQVPFSDPIADGETIMRANDVALDNSTDTAGSFELIKKARARGLTAEVYIMSYLQKVIHFGVEKFCRQANAAGVKGLIIPDMPFDSPEYKEVFEAAKGHSLQIVPVVSPGMNEQRLKKALVARPPLVYLTSTKGITGNKLSVSEGLGELCGSVRRISPGSAVAIGFGIQSKKDVNQVLKIADIAVVGSAVIRKIENSGIKAALKLVNELI